MPHVYLWLLISCTNMGTGHILFTHADRIGIFHTVAECEAAAKTSTTQQLQNNIVLYATEICEEAK